MSHSEPEEFLTVAEVAATLKLNQQTVRNWIDQGSLPALRVGRRVRIKRSDFERISRKRSRRRSILGQWSEIRVSKKRVQPAA